MTQSNVGEAGGMEGEPMPREMSLYSGWDGERREFEQGVLQLLAGEGAEPLQAGEGSEDN